MKKLMLFTIIGCLAIASLQAQVKRQYRDADRALTMVVVKDETEMSDIDILNAQYNLAEVSVNEEFRITTERDPYTVEDPAPEPDFTAEVPQDQTPIIQEFDAEIPTKEEPDETPVRTVEVEAESASESAIEAEAVAVAQEKQVLRQEPVTVATPINVANSASNKTEKTTSRVARTSTQKTSTSLKKKKRKKRKKRVYLKKRRKSKRKNYNKCYAF